MTDGFPLQRMKEDTWLRAIYSYSQNVKMRTRPKPRKQPEIMKNDTEKRSKFTTFMAKQTVYREKNVEQKW